jgi:peptidoglycan L-alanyl-D-glutamate endopeptidase CwlK
MSTLGKTSKARLMACHDDLKRLVEEVAKTHNITVLCGHRTQEEQNEAFTKGNYKAPWPKSKHNQLPSLAVDIAPYPINWQNLQSFIDLSKVVKSVADDLGIKIIWGGDFKSFKDMPHYELEG